MKGSNTARVLVDEDLTPRPVRLLKSLKYDIDRVPMGAKDTDIIRSLGTAYGCKGVWITADRTAMTEHRQEILSAGISIALLNMHSALRVTQAFMIFSFMYRRDDLILNSNAPSYFKLSVRKSNRGPNVAIAPFSL